MSKFLITGGSGFIGTNIIESLLKDKQEVLNLDIKAPQYNEHLSYWKQLDILDRKKFTHLALDFDPDYIIHLAAVADLDGTDLKYYDANITGVQNLIDIAAQIESLKKVIFTSSMYVCKPGIIPKDFNTYTAHTVYGQSKVQGEYLVKNIKEVKYEWIIIRPTSIWGPWFGSPYIDFFESVYKGQYVDFGKACTKTYGYVGNSAYQILQLISTDAIHKKTFYIGDLPPTQIAEWGNEISIRMNKGKLKKVPFFALKLASYVGDVFKVIGIKFPLTSFRLSNMTTNNVLPLEEIYNVAPHTPFSRLEGIDKTLTWLQKYKNYKF